MFTQKKSKPGKIQNNSSESLIQPLAVQLRENGTQAHERRSSESSHISPESFQPYKPIQAKSKSSGDVPVQKSEVPNNSSKNETGMPDSLKSGLENLSGKDLSGVRVHHNSSKPDAIQAHAYTQGKEIHLAPGQEKHLPHEGWHVVQQMQGRVQPTIQQKSALINDDSSLEHEADVMGQRALHTQASDSTNSTNTANTTPASNVIQRAMKFEFQVKKNRLYRDDGRKVTSLPRKYGPRDYLVHLPNGGRLENETHGQVEYETPWEKKWSKLKKQINDMQSASLKMHNAATVKGSDGITYKKFPFAAEIEHLSPDKGFNVSGGRWSKSQKEGDAEVNSTTDTKENLRSSASFSSASNIIQTIKNGEEVFIHFFSSDRKWAKISYKGKNGWMWSSSLKTTSKYFESNKDDQPNPKNPKKPGFYTDTPLKKGEKILLNETDTNWNAYIQPSESFEMTQFESFLNQYDPVKGATITSSNRAFMEKYNPNKAPIGEGPLSKMFREMKFRISHPKLYNLLLMIDLVIQDGQNKKTPPGTVKYAFTLMSRTNFGSMFKSMSKAEQQLFTKMVLDKKNGFLPKMGVSSSTKVFAVRDAKDFNPTIYNWLVGITKGKDILSVQTSTSLPAAMGRFNIEDEKGKHKGLIRYEARKVGGNSADAINWEKYAFKQFKAAMDNRSRPTGKNQTGLEL